MKENETRGPDYSQARGCPLPVCRMRSVRYFAVLMLFGASLFFSYHSYAAAAWSGEGGRTAEEALYLGEQIYQKGVLPSGMPLQAVVQGDLLVRGGMATCTSCHMKSGLGSFEGGVLTPPSNGERLFRPLQSGLDLPGSGMARGELINPRPAYTEETLSRALRTGVDPAGRILSRTMPRYLFDASDMKLLIHYLRNLSSVYSAGVDDSGVRFATVVAGEVSQKEQQALLEPLKAYIRDEWNAFVPVLAQLQRDDSYRPLSLEVWELKGPAETWRAQLEALYRQKPVFGLLGGISSDAWGPVHRFCETNRIPCILPITELPEISGRDTYTLYFSKGYYQEGEAAAKYLARASALPPDRKIVQVFRDTAAGKALAQGFSETWHELGNAGLENRIVSPEAVNSKDFVQNLAGSDPGAVLLLWLGPEDLSVMAGLDALMVKPPMLFVSATLLRGTVSALPDTVRDVTYITWPNRLPDEGESIRAMVSQWLSIRKAPLADLEISSRVYLLTRLLANVLTGMRGNFYRDYFLDLFDLLEDQTNTVAAYPRLSFGPGQRYASKGCYIVKLTTGLKPQVLRQSDWVVH